MLRSTRGHAATERRRNATGGKVIETILHLGRRYMLVVDHGKDQHRVGRLLGR